MGNGVIGLYVILPISDEHRDRLFRFWIGCSLASDLTFMATQAVAVANEEGSIHVSNAEFVWGMNRFVYVLG